MGASFDDPVFALNFTLMNREKAKETTTKNNPKPSKSIHNNVSCHLTKDEQIFTRFTRWAGLSCWWTKEPKWHYRSNKKEHPKKSTETCAAAVAQAGSVKFIFIIPWSLLGSAMGARGMGVVAHHHHYHVHWHSRAMGMCKVGTNRCSNVSESWFCYVDFFLTEIQWGCWLHTGSTYLYTPWECHPQNQRLLLWKKHTFIEGRRDAIWNTRR